MKDSLIKRIHRAQLELAHSEIVRWETEIEGLRAKRAGARPEEDIAAIVRRLNLKEQVRGLIRHDRVLTEDQRGTFYV